MGSYLLQQFLNGLQLGSIYALIALGYSMVYGIIKLINFAHADIFMVGAYIAFFVTAFSLGSSVALPWELWIWISLIAGYLLFIIMSERIRPVRGFLDAIDASVNLRTGWHARWALPAAKSLIQIAGIAVLSAVSYPVLYFGTHLVFSVKWGAWYLPVVCAYVMAMCALLGIAMERIAYRPLRHKPRLSALITALGISLFLENFCSLDMVFSNRYRAFPQLIAKSEWLRLDSAGIIVTNIFFINCIVLSVMLAGLWFLVEKTLIGKQMRAVSYDKKAAALMGIDVDRVIATTFAIGPALAGVSGILYAMNYGILQSPFLGFFPGLKAFIAAVLGGIGSLPGAVIGALIMGITEVFANSVDSNLGFAAAFVILIVILLIKPNGIWGKSEDEKV